MRWPARCSWRAPDALAPPELLPGPVRQAVASMAGAPGAWCPALAPDADRVAFVIDCSGIPRLEVAPLDGGTPTVLSGPAEETLVALTRWPDLFAAVPRWPG